MLEILVLWGLGKKIAAMASAKGHAPGGYVALLVVSWIIGEVGGIILGMFLTGAMHRADDDMVMLLPLLCALIGIVVAAMSSFALVAALPDRKLALERLEDDRDPYEDRWDDRRGGRDAWDRDDRIR